ncbi:lysE type translocator family protein [Escherichia coli 97.1742]|nr:lysE type translocator family protein [Escherichia coli 97.1742]
MFAEYGVLNYWTYLVGAIFIVLVPGPNTLFVLKNSVSSGMKGGYLAACGTRLSLKMFSPPQTSSTWF